MGNSAVRFGIGDVVPESVLDAKGDLLAGTAADTVARLAVGTNDQVLTAASGEATGMKWAAGAGGSIPAGMVTEYGGASAPTGWLLCDGAAVSRATYADLFTAIGTAYGAGNGSTTFNVPDTRGRATVGKGSHADVDALGDSDGVAEGSRRPKHAHTSALTFTGSAVTSGTESADHTHTAPWLSNGAQPGDGGAAGGTGTGPATGGRSATHTHQVTAAGTIGGTIGTAGVTDSPAYLVFNYIIKT